LIKADRNGLPLDCMKNTETAIRHDGRLGRIEWDVPLEASINRATAFDVPAQVRAGIH
jgi:hypothetical protein